MKHEVFNSILGALGLAIAAVTAWHQFAPNTDDLEIVNEGRTSLGRELVYKPIHLGNLLGEGPMLAASPVSWRLRIFNPTDHPVSIVAYDVYLLTDKDGRVQYSGIRGRFSPFDPSLPEQDLPEVLEPREARAYLFSTPLPFRADNSIETRCEEIAKQLRPLELCFFDKGRDLFGNPVTVTRYDTAPDSAFSVSWESGIQSPVFEVVFTTADGSQFGTKVSYFPDF